jgi:hypothetical protein
MSNKRPQGSIGLESEQERRLPTVRAPNGTKKIMLKESERNKKKQRAQERGKG